MWILHKVVEDHMVNSHSEGLEGNHSIGGGERLSMGAKAKPK